MQRHSRRRVLGATGGALVGLAGCLDSSDPGAGGTGTTDDRASTTTEERTTDTTSRDGSGVDAGVGTTHDVDGRTVRLLSARTSRAIVTLLSSAHPSVSAERDRQYVVVALDVSGDEPMDATRFACELRVGNDAVDPVSDVVQPFTESTHLAFSLPLDVDAGTVALAWVGESSTATWSLPARVAASLEAPPAFEVESFDVPERADGDAVQVSFTVANVGAGDGEFLAELGTTALSDQGEVRVQVPAGETRTLTESVGLVPSVGDQTIVLDWGWNSLERTVSVPTTTE